MSSAEDPARDASVTVDEIMELHSLARITATRETAGLRLAGFGYGLLLLVGLWMFDMVFDVPTTQMLGAIVIGSAAILLNAINRWGLWLYRHGLFATDLAIRIHDKGAELSAQLADNTVFGAAAARGAQLGGD